MVSTTPLAVLGEVRTCLLPSSVTLAHAEASALLALMPGHAVRWRERPGSLGISPATAVGVDCELPLDDLTARIVGTVATSVTLTGGRVLQSSARTRVVRAGERRRQSWSHYISRKGVTEVISRVPARETAGKGLVEGYLTHPPDIRHLDLASISDRLLTRVRNEARILDQEPPIQAGTTRLRWTAIIGGSNAPTATLHLDGDSVRSVRLTVRQESDLTDAQRFCEDLAAHDWLLTVLSGVLAEADRHPRYSSERMQILAPALEHLTGLWMPGAHTPPSLRSLWNLFQKDPGFTRQWSTLVDRVRDNIAVGTWYGLQHRVFGPHR